MDERLRERAREGRGGGLINEQCLGELGTLAVVSYSQMLAIPHRRQEKKIKRHWTTAYSSPPLLD